MATVSIQVRIDEELKKQSMELFSQLGIDMSSAMNMFLKQCVMRGGLPFAVEIPQYKSETPEVVEEARRISQEILREQAAAMLVMYLKRVEERADKEGRIDANDLERELELLD